MCSAQVRPSRGTALLFFVIDLIAVAHGLGKQDRHRVWQSSRSNSDVAEHMSLNKVANSLLQVDAIQAHVGSTWLTPGEQGAEHENASVVQARNNNTRSLPGKQGAKHRSPPVIQARNTTLPAPELLSAKHKDTSVIQVGPPSSNIFDKLNRAAEVWEMRHSERLVGRDMFVENVKAGLTTILFGALFFLIAIPIQWFNEERSVRMDTLLSRGLEECVSIDCNDLHPSNRGKLVHVQGRSIGAMPVVDPQFQDALVKHCLKLQSTVEVFEWVQTTRTWLEGKERRSQPRFHTEWTTIHHDSLRFRKPSPENPRLPSGLSLGTFTTVCKRVELGAFVLTDEMVNLFHKFEPAMKHLPSRVTAHGLTFYANTEDGYFYMRPSAAPSVNPARLFHDHQVGDVRVRFMCVPEGNATVVAVQCKKDGCESFVPYRTIPRAPCITDVQERQKLIEEGERPLKDLRREIACCSGGVSTCCCCPCNTIACCCTSEVITEEIFFVSDRLDPVEKPFQWVVQRNPCRVWNFRLIGWAVMFLGSGMILGPFSGSMRDAPGLRSFGSAAAMVLAAIITLATSTLIVSAAYVCYRPLVSLKWMCVICVVILIPLLWGSLGYGSRG
mmetsp:Transcript_49780/g.115546  ORF Transcript_49780/g.115546 Transcript_49780/m.115546 type:complete len:612 (+) Transcript_49780:111-1946(+)